MVRFWSLKKQIDKNLILETLEYANNAKSGNLLQSRKQPLVNIFKSQALEDINFFLTETCVFLVHLIQPFFMVKFSKQVLKSSKKIQNYKKFKKFKKFKKITCSCYFRKIVQMHAPFPRKAPLSVLHRN